MKKNNLIIASLTLFTVAAISFTLAGCRPGNDPGAGNSTATASDAPSPLVIEMEDTAAPEEAAIPEATAEAEKTPKTEEQAIPEEAQTDKEQDAAEGSANEEDEKPDQTEPEKDIPDIVWLGDSLTQGSLGDDNHNQNNPQAPWRVLGDISGLDVSGVGFFGYKTHDIFWAYGEYNGIKHPDIVYIYWVGSNDFYESVDNIDNVIDEIDRFNQNIGVKRYLVLGTTNRGDMDPTAYIPINRRFSNTYKDRYLDIMPYVEYGSDGIHLTEESYAAVAQAVYDKLRAMKWF